MRIISNIKVGAPDVRPDKPAHVKGVMQGNRPHHVYGPEDGMIFVHTDLAKANSRRSTGINAADRDPIDPRSPNLPPA